MDSVLNTLGMGRKNIHQLVSSVDNLAETFRNTDLGWQSYVFPEEHTNWIEEQRAVSESVAVVDQSHHMEILEITGIEAVDLLSYLGVNNFERIRSEEPPQALNLIVCNPDGDVIGDNILFYLDETEFQLIGSELANNWVRYHANTGEWQAEAEVLYHHEDDHDPPDFRFQVQGPHAMDVIEEVIDGGLPQLSFFEMDVIEINDVATHALSHGMAAMPGLEIFGDYDHHDEVLETILSAGEAFDIRQLGSASYKTGKIGSGWFVFVVPAIYEHPELEDYRKWLSADRLEGRISIGGSFDSSDIKDYYLNPMERGQGSLIDFDHDFVGKDALADIKDQEQRDRVTLVWNSEDMIDVYASLFQEGQTNKFIDLPDVANRWSIMHYDKIIKNGDVVGLSKYPGYLYYEREMLSLATIDPEYSDPGTRVKFLWGDQSDKRRVERHEPIEIRATVAKAPYVEGGRRQR